MTEAKPDPRQAAHDAVFDFLRQNPARTEDGYEAACQNARVWRAVNAALDAMGVPQVSMAERYPRHCTTSDGSHENLVDTDRALPDVAEPRRRIRACVENWPEAETGGYDPRCCRFPKSCSADVYDPERVSDDDLEQLTGGGAA